MQGVLVENTKGGRQGGERTRPAVDVVEICYAVLVRALAHVAIEARPSVPAYDHRLVEVLVELKGTLAGLHELCGLREVVLLAPRRLLACTAAAGSDPIEEP